MLNNGSLNSMKNIKTYLWLLEKVIKVELEMMINVGAIKCPKKSDR